MANFGESRDGWWNRDQKRTTEERGEQHGGARRKTYSVKSQYEQTRHTKDIKPHDEVRSNISYQQQKQNTKATKKVDRKKIQEQKLHQKQKGQRISLLVQNFNGNENDLKSLFCRATKVRFPVGDFQREGDSVCCYGQFESSRQFKDALSDFHTFNKHARARGGTGAVNIQVKQQLRNQIPFKQQLSECIDKIADDAKSALDEHDEKIRNTEERLSEIMNGLEQRKKNFITLEDFNRKEEETKAVRFKLEEMRKQKEEYKHFLRNTVDELKEAECLKNGDSILKDILTAFKVECRRLKSALPMYAKRTDIISTVKENQVTVLIGETGSGKSTQIAQYMFQAGLANKGMIVCTQPRKIAAVTLAGHVAQEMGTSVGQLVGYKVGMQVKQSRITKIMYMTDHVLLNECLLDKQFSAYSCIIVDEAHERSIYTDLLLGMIKKCINNRPDLRVVVTSATIDPKVFVDYFGQCPILEVSGRMFPVDVVYSDEDVTNETYEQVALDKAIEIHNEEPPGDVLVFLTSPLEVERCCTAFKEIMGSESKYVCLPLHGRLQPIEQEKVFDETPKGKRKIVFATNSAETSITIPGIKYVVDTGVAKEMMFDPKRNISSLCVTTVTKSSADQRKGRAGRTDTGKCYRLYSSTTYEEMSSNSKPEILRVHLGHAMLKLMELGVVPLDFDFVQSPPRALMDAAMETLEFVGAVAKGKITKTGTWIAKLPIDPKFGAFVFDAIEQGLGIEAIVLSACCAASGTLFYRFGTIAEKAKADKLKVRFCHEGGDLLTMLNVYREWHTEPETSKGQWCLNNSINGKAIRGIRDTVNEVLTVLRKDLGRKPKFELKAPTLVDDKLQKLLFRAFSRNLCHFSGNEKAGYIVANKFNQVQIFPASSLKSLGLLPDWLVLEQVLNTSRDYAINVTPVRTEWIEQAIKEKWIHIDLERILSQRVEQVALLEVGEQVFKDFVGNRYSKLRNLEESIATSDDPVTIEASKQCGEIVIYARRSTKSEIPTIVTNNVEALRHKMRMDKREEFLSSTNSGVRVEIGAGLEVVDVLMADEYRTIFVTGIPTFIEDKTEEEMKERFRRYGKIVKAEKFVKSKNKNNWGKITFERREDAENAVRKVKDDLDISARPSIGFKSADVHIFRTKLEWCRRPSRGFGFIAFSDPMNAMRAIVTPIVVAGNVVRIKPSKNGSSEVHVANLTRYVNEDVLRQSVSDALGLEPNDFNKVTVIRERVTTSSEMMGIFGQRIRRQVEPHVKEGSYNLDLRHPKDADFTFLAFVSFSKPEEGMAACSAIDHKFVMNNETVTMKPDLKTSVMLQKSTYQRYSENLETLIERLNVTEPITIQQRELRNGNVVFNLHSDSVETIIKVKGDILSATRGLVVDVETNDDVNKLFTWDGKRFLNSVKEETDTNIVFDERILSISIHGEEAMQNKAVGMIEEYLKDLKDGKSRMVVLKGEDKPPGLMKELMIRYDFDLSKLQIEADLKTVDLNHRSHSVQLVGEEQSIEKAMGLIDNIIKTMWEKRANAKPMTETSRDCVVCLCPIDEGELYRVEICGHAYCKDCVQLQFKSAVRNNMFPLTCSQDGCNEPWSMKDITSVALKTAVPFSVLVKKATSSFVAQNKTAYRYCPTADCPLIYRITDTERLFYCPECEVRICTSCHNQYHDGLTCKMVESMKKDDGGLKLWLRQNATRAKLCPKCTTPIEKIDGCNHMTCLGCKAHICWVCLQYFDTSDQCYRHLQRAHGTFM